MRLSSRLSDKEKSHGKIESFIDFDKYTTSEDEVTDDVALIADGTVIAIQIGRINLPFYSTICNDSVSFMSDRTLHCLIINKSMVSIDCQLMCNDFDEGDPKCQRCVPYVQAWFLVEADDIYAAEPDVNVVKQNFKLPEAIKMPIEIEDKISEWLGKAEIAYKERLGAGSIIYLRSAFEQITIEVGRDAGVDICKPSGKVKPFDQVLRAVDKQCSIIPEIYSNNGYELFRELSNIAHGNSDEDTALREYEPLRRLVIGIVENIKRRAEEIKNNAEIQKALDEIGFVNGEEQDE